MASPVRIIIPEAATLIENQLHPSFGKLPKRLRQSIINSIAGAAYCREIPLLGVQVTPTKVRIIALFPSKRAKELARSFVISVFSKSAGLLKRRLGDKHKRVWEGAEIRSLVDDYALAKVVNAMGLCTTTLRENWRAALKPHHHNEIVCDIVHRFRTAADAVPELIRKLNDKHEKKSEAMQAARDLSERRAIALSSLLHWLNQGRRDGFRPFRQREAWLNYVENNLTLHLPSPVTRKQL